MAISWPLITVITGTFSVEVYALAFPYFCRFMLEDLPEERSFLQPGQPAPVGPQPRHLFVIKVEICSKAVRGHY